MTDQGLVYALLVGIDAYQSPWPALAGCGNDVTEAEAVLRTLVQDRLRLKVLRDGEATRKRVMAEFTTHLGQAGPDDVAFFWFSGHGSDEPVAAEHWHLEPTGRSQTLVCVDSRHQGVADLSDKTLSAMIDLVAESGAHVAVVLDCCHSGSGTRDPESAVRGIPPAVLAPPDSAPAPSATKSRDTVATGSAAAPHVALSACRSFEKARERVHDGRMHGVFSAALFTALQTLGPRATYRSLHSAIRDLVQHRTVFQTPVLHPIVAQSAADQPFLGGAVVTPSSFTLRWSGTRWQVDAGRCHGIPAIADGPTTLAVASADSRSAGRKLKVIGVRTGTCDVQPVDWTPEPDRQYPVVIEDLPVPAVGVVVEDNASADIVRAELMSSPVVTLVDPDAPVSMPRLRIVARTGHERPELVILRDDSSPAAPPVPGGGASSARTVAAQTDHIARWTLLKELDNPAWSVHGLVDVRILAAEPDGFGRWRPAGPIAPNPAGEIELAYRHTPDGWEAPQVHIEIHNGHDRRLWCTLLNLTDRYRSHTALFPGDFIAAHHTAAVAEGQPIPVELPEDRPVIPGAVVRDWCKIIVAPHEINTTPYELPPLASPSRAGQQRRLRDMGTPSTPKVQGEWATLLVPIVTVVPG